MNTNVDYSVIIRYSGERTLELCKYSLAFNDVVEGNMIVLENISPFSKTLMVAMEQALELGCEYCFLVDADLVVFPGVLDVMVKMFSMYTKKHYMLNPLMVDNLTGKICPGGPHLYRTELFTKALTFAQKLGDTKRPETSLINLMRDKGYGSVYVDLISCLHDYEQYNRHIFRKVITKLFKGNCQKAIVERMQTMVGSDDFTVVKAAYDYYGTYKDELDFKYQFNEYDTIFSELDIGEKCSIADVEKKYSLLLENYSPELYKFDIYSDKIFSKNIPIKEFLINKLFGRLNVKR